MKRIYGVGAGVLALVPMTGHAAATVKDTGALEEIVVTAQRRSENLQDVPISISAFSGETLEKLNAKGAGDYLAATPNVSFTEDKQSGSRGLTVSIRGVNNLVTGENAFVNSVGVYLDEFSIASVPNGVANPFMPDMERVEVLRGPQGTLFGRNALGGALNLSTRDPNSRDEGSVTVGGEAYSSWGHSESVNGTWNIPVSDTFKMRAVLSYEDSTGMVHNINPNGNGADHIWLNARVKMLWTPSVDTRVTFSFLEGVDKQGADETIPSGVNDLDSIDTFGYQPGKAFDPGTGFWPNNQSRFSADLTQKNEDTTTIMVLNVAHKLSSNMTWKTILGSIKTDNNRYFDNDLVGNLDLLSRTNHYTGNSRSIETRIESSDEKSNWVVGVMYAQDKQDQDNNVAVSTNPTASLIRDGAEFGFLPPFPAGLGLSKNVKHFSVGSFAAFFDKTTHWGPHLETFYGARYTKDSVDRDYQGYGIHPTTGFQDGAYVFFQSFVNFARTPAKGGANFDDVTPRIGLRYKFNDDSSVYATLSRGYKAGGLSMGNSATGAPLAGPFRKETLWNYEAGFKSEFMDHKVRLNADVFYMKWTDLQMEAFRFLVPGDLSTNFEQTINIPSAEAKGAELELTARVSEHFTVGASLGYLDTKILENQSCTDGALDPDCSGGHKLSTITGGYKVDLVGLPIPNSPKVTASAFGEFRVPMGSNSAWVRGEYQHRDSQYSDIEGITNRQTRGPSPNAGLTRDVPADEFPYKVPAFDVINLRGGYDWEKMSMAVYVLNVADEHYYTGTYQKFGLSGMRLRPHPRTIGANFTFRF